MSDMPLHERNLNYAKMAVGSVSWKMKIGANNKAADVLSSGLKSFFCVPKTRKHYRDLPLTLNTIRKISLHATQAECGNCGEQAAIAFMWLLERKIGPLDYMSRTNADHAFVLMAAPT